MPIVSKTGYCNKWGSDKGARRVAGLTEKEKNAILAGKVVYITGCPVAYTANGGSTTRRRVILSGRRFYARMP